MGGTISNYQIAPRICHLASCEGFAESGKDLLDFCLSRSGVIGAIKFLVAFDQAEASSHTGQDRRAANYEG